MKIAIIPARGGSKRIPRKNIRDFHGKPIIAWSIRAALDAGCFDQVLVSTDDEEIARIASEHGALVPFIRPAELADDFCATVPVIAHAVHWCLEQGMPLEAACCVYATAPLIRHQAIAEALRLLEEQSVDYVFPVTRFSYPIARALRLDDRGLVEMLHPEHAETRSQDLEDCYHDAGQFYWGRVDAWLEGRPIVSGCSGSVVIPRHHVQDIDDEEDWRLAEVLFSTFAQKP